MPVAKLTCFTEQRSVQFSMNEISSMCYLRYQHHVNGTTGVRGDNKEPKGGTSGVCGWSNLVQAHQGGHIALDIDGPHTRFEWI